MVSTDPLFVQLSNQLTRAATVVRCRSRPTVSVRVSKYKAVGLTSILHRGQQSPAENGIYVFGRQQKAPFSLFDLKRKYRFRSDSSRPTLDHPCHAMNEFEYMVSCVVTVQPRHRASWTTPVKFWPWSGVTSSYRAGHVGHRCPPSRGIVTGTIQLIDSVSEFRSQVSVTVVML